MTTPLANHRQNLKGVDIFDLLQGYENTPLIGESGGQFLGRVIIEVWDTPNVPGGKGTAYTWDLPEGVNLGQVFGCIAKDMEQFANSANNEESPKG